MFDVEPTQELFEPLIVELSAIVHDDCLEETIVAYYGFSDERLSQKFHDIGHRLGLDPFGEIVHRDEKKLSLEGRFWEGS